MEFWQNKMADNPAITVAKYVIAKCDHDDFPVTNLTLQCMLYFLYQEYRRRDKYLFFNDIQIELWGPKIVEVYDHFCGSGAMQIRSLYSYEECRAVIPPEDLEIIDPVIDRYKKLICFEIERLALEDMDGAPIIHELTQKAAPQKKGVTMREYHKIDTVYERDPATKKLIVGKFRDETVEFLKDNTWEFTEKVDGTNIRVCWDGHGVSFAGRTDRAVIPTPLMNRLKELFEGEINEQMFEQKFGERQVILFGEGYGPKIQKGGGYRDDVDFILFDVMIGDNYQSRETVEDVAYCFGLDAVPIILTGSLQDGIDYVISHNESTIAKNGAPLEGIVGRPKIEMNSRVGKRVIVKIKGRDFVA